VTSLICTLFDLGYFFNNKIFCEGLHYPLNGKWCPQENKIK
jgi:hypothetical protein